MVLGLDHSGTLNAPSNPSWQRHWYSYSALDRHWPPFRQGRRSQGLLSTHVRMALLSVKL